MLLINNGKYRRAVFVIRRFLDGVESYTGGFPVFEDIRNSFAEYPYIDDVEFKTMPEPDYQNRLGAFYAYLSLKYPFFNASTDIPDETDPERNSHGIDLDSCPMDLPSGISARLILRAFFSSQGGERFAEIRALLVDKDGQPVPSPYPIQFSTIIKDSNREDQEDLDMIQGIQREFVLETSESEKSIFPVFRYRGTAEVRFVQVILEPIQGEEPIFTGLPNKVTVSFHEPCFLFNHISNLQQAYQDMISHLKAQEAIDSSLGIKILGKRDYRFIFEPDQPKRPVFIYPKSWGKLSEVLLIDRRDEIELLSSGAFLFNGSEPFEFTLEIEGTDTECYVYASRSMIIYPYSVEYLFRF